MTARQRLAIATLFAICVLSWVGCGGGAKEQHPTTIIVESSPESGAAVTINGEPYGETPVTARGLAPGAVLVEVTKEGYKDAYDTIRVPDQGEARFELKMEPLVGYVTIMSEPDGADVYLDGRVHLGVTPLIELPLPSGQRTLELRKERYQNATVTLDVRTDFKYRKTYALTPKKARLQVYSMPTGANVWLNNQILAEKTPVQLDLAPGAYTVSVYARGYVMAEDVVELNPADERVVDLKMKEGAAPPGMVLIPGGEFLFGEDNQAPDERPRQAVMLDAYYIDKYEVTNAQYKAVFPSHTFEEEFENYPVTNVSWEQASAYAAAVGKRLPTEQEWEKAARGADGRAYPWGELFDDSLANTGGGINPKPTEVGEFRGGASPYGCLDMAGNVYEWTSSWYKAYTGNSEIKKDYGQVYRVLRGGSFRTSSYDARCAKRHYARMDATRDDYGFRCVADVADTSGKPGTK
ncbi:MAG: SUMF1/EgtB/PvdO family nonheme iron enzyme [Candidatus Hydrogenedentes bacterium]|nr:SUMF1/EgtB/PvdO family nonheme iron enzyme [Candidatus Hydrogenedentota bacterium]